MDLKSVLDQLEAFGDEQTKKTLLKHGAKEPFFGVKVADLKKLVRKIKKDHELSLELYATGNSDAMYLAGLIADETKITKEQLNMWADQAYWYYLSEFTVPFVAAESPYGFELGKEWIESEKEHIAAAGWATLGYYSGITADQEIDISFYKSLLKRAEEQVHSAQNRVKYVMNGFIIAVGGYIPELTELSKSVANSIGKVEVKMGGTACKVPLATAYIKKIEDRGKVGVKRKSARK